ncbi:hypothetical protein C162_20211 [Paenibacillus sp. FSL R7-269]|uniref:hypothetical protein n=1 Tax=Paenibacillus sp. FSL R7-269 TaxID=1226755 RepID=UPI0003E2AF29|nr:hypothetical protein [Paenibacillus sp. FSL R7-269]ETT45694.1 hypothetical protein C162_20211 [Paenibacillus sp. FSL R7-269]
MDNVVFSRQDHTVTGLNRPAGPAEYSLSLPFPIAITKLQPWVNGEKQKTNDGGQLLYYSKPILEEDGSETVNEVTTDRIATAWEEVTQEYTLVNDDGSKTPVSNTTQIATEWEDLEPVLIPNVQQYQVTFAEQPSLFTYQELQAAKLSGIKKAYQGLVLVYYDEEFALESFAVELADHAANLGDGLLAIHPGGQCRTVKLLLGKSAGLIRLYLEAQEGITVEIGATAANLIAVVDGQVKLATASDSVYLRFTNTAESYREVYAFGLLA